MKKINILFRWLDCNNYTLSALAGLVDDKFDPIKVRAGFFDSPERLSGILNEKNTTQVLAYSFPSARADFVKAEIALLKSGFKDRVVIICGGPHATARPEEMVEAGADAVFCGEAEESLPLFLSQLHEDKSVLKNRIFPSITPAIFDSYPPFAYKRDFFAPIEIRRGCGNRCAFCQTPAIFPEVRERSLEYVKHYSGYIKSGKRKAVFFTLQDALMYGSRDGKVNLEWLKLFLQEISGLGMEINYGCFPSEISPKSLASAPEAAGMLKKYIKNTKVILGGQSGSERILKLMKRNHSVADIINSVKISGQAGFLPIVDIIIGFPGETYYDRLETINLMKFLYSIFKTQFNIHCFTPLPGTELENSIPEQIEDDIKEIIFKLFDDSIAHGDFKTNYKKGRALQ